MWSRFGIVKNRKQERSVLMHYPIKVPKQLLAHSLCLVITMISMTACAASPDEKITPSQSPPSDPNSAPDGPSAAVQFDKIQQTLGQMNNTLNKARSDAPSAKVPVANAPAPKVANNAMEMTSDTPQSPSSMSKGKMMKSMPSNKTPAKRGMGMCKGMMCKKMMMGMSMMGQPPAAKATSLQAGDPLPGYPNAPHLYHLGEADFFLDHAQRLSLSPEQNASLTAIKNRWTGQEKNIDAQISRQEQALWQATAKGQPDSVDIHKKVADIEALNSRLRLAFITSVGKAVAVLTPEQVAVLMQAEQSR
tara:strand:+ start:8218 stop:9132 length:915 start_codon:yes stop_codon:yes gene_type:complete